MKKIGYLLIVPTLIVSLVFIYLYYLESFNYDNYVFATLHINLARFAVLPGIFWVTWTTYYLWSKKIKALYIIIATIFCLVTIPSGIQAMGNVIARTHQMFLGKAYIVQKAQTKTFGNDYIFINFIKNYLVGDPNTTIILPPNQLPWRHTGNSQIMNSLLYPITTTNNINAKVPYLLISSEEDGAGYHLWPDFKVSASQIIIYNWDSGQPTIITGKDWNPTEWQDKKPWGLIRQKPW